MAMQVARNLQRESIWHLKVNVLTSKWTMWKVEVDIGKRIGKSRKLSGKVKILPMMAHNLWPAVQERLQRSMDSMIFKAQFIVVSHHGVFDMFYHFWLRWTHWSSPFWYFKHGGMMWDVLPRTVYQPVANTQAIQFDASTLQVGDLYDLCRCLRFFTTSFVHRHPHYVMFFISFVRGVDHDGTATSLAFGNSNVKLFVTAPISIAAVRYLPSLGCWRWCWSLLVRSTWPYATRSKWHMTSKANCGSCQRSVCCLGLYFWLYWK